MYGLALCSCDILIITYYSSQMKNIKHILIMFHMFFLMYTSFSPFMIWIFCRTYQLEHNNNLDDKCYNTRNIRYCYFNPRMSFWKFEVHVTCINFTKHYIYCNVFSPISIFFWTWFYKYTSIYGFWTWTVDLKTWTSQMMTR